MANNGYEKEERREWAWSDLPTELMELILQNCNFSDQARVRAVCRIWQSIPRVQALIKQLPWLMSYDHRDWSSFKLFDLNYKKTYTKNMSTMNEYEQEHDHPYLSLHASKSGWLLFSHIVTSSKTFFLYSPFTNRMMQLPNLKTFYSSAIATFTTEPTSADCVFFVLQKISHTNTMEASTCRLGDTKWTTHVFPGSFDAINDVVFSQGLLWFVNRCGRLATFCVAQGIWKELQSPALVLPSNYMQDQTFLVESNGNLLLVLIFFFQKHKSRLFFKLDRSQMAWILVEDVGDENLFLDQTSISAPKFGGGGKIRYSWRHYKKFHSKKRKRSYTNHVVWIEPPILY